MKMKIKHFSLFIILIFAIVINLTFKSNTLDINASLESISKIAFANEEAPITACVKITYYSTNMEPCFSSSNCYNSSGQLCGEQRCCESTPASTSCNEYDCI